MYRSLFLKHLHAFNLQVYFIKSDTLGQVIFDYVCDISTNPFFTKFFRK